MFWDPHLRCDHHKILLPSLAPDVSSSTHYYSSGEVPRQPIQYTLQHCLCKFLPQGLLICGHYCQSSSQSIAHVVRKIEVERSQNERVLTWTLHLAAHESSEQLAFQAAHGQTHNPRKRDGFELGPACKLQQRCSAPTHSEGSILPDAFSLFLRRSSVFCIHYPFVVPVNVRSFSFSACQIPQMDSISGSALCQSALQRMS